MTVRFVSKESEQLPATSTEIYECPANSNSASIIFANCTNEDASDATIQINLVQKDGSVADTNIYLKSKNVLSGSTDNLDEIIGAILEPGDKIYAIAGNADRLNLKLGIKELF
jgi:hypothetical protein